MACVWFSNDWLLELAVSSHQQPLAAAAHYPCTQAHPSTHPTHPPIPRTCTASSA